MRRISEHKSKSQNKFDNKNSSKYNCTLHGMVTVGPKSQIVIPASARKEIGLEPGDQLLVCVKLGKAIALVKANQIDELHEALEEEMQEMQRTETKAKIRK